MNPLLSRDTNSYILSFFSPADAQAIGGINRATRKTAHNLALDRYRKECSSLQADQRINYISKLIFDQNFLNLKKEIVQTVLTQYIRVTPKEFKEAEGQKGSFTLKYNEKIHEQIEECLNLYDAQDLRNLLQQKHTYEYEAIPFTADRIKMRQLIWKTIFQKTDTVRISGNPDNTVHTHYHGFWNRSNGTALNEAECKNMAEAAKEVGKPIKLVVEYYHINDSNLKILQDNFATVDSTQTRRTPSMTNWKKRAIVVATIAAVIFFVIFPLVFLALNAPLAFILAIGGSFGLCLANIAAMGGFCITRYCIPDIFQKYYWRR